jgi:hypothetical protein
MDEEKKKKMKEALKSNESFLEFLKQGAESDDYQKLRERIEKGPHPTGEMLYDYVLNWTEDIDDEKIMDHIAFCSICSKEVLNIMKIEQDLEEDMLDWVNKQSLIQRLKNLVSSLSLPVYGFPADSLVTRTKTSEEEKYQYAVGESMVFCVPVTSDGYLVIIHYDEDGKVTMVFPTGPQDDNFLSSGTEKKISGKITGPTGKQFFKAIWTSRKLVDPKKITFQNDKGVEHVINKFLDALDKLNAGEWIEMTYGIEVTED